MTINLELQNHSTSNLSGTFTGCDINSNIINETDATNNILKLFLLKKINMDELQLKNKLELLVSKLNREIKSLSKETGIMPVEIANYISNNFTQKHSGNKECINIVDKIEGDQIIVSGRASFTKNQNYNLLEQENVRLKTENSDLLKLNAEKDNTIKALNDEVFLLKTKK